MQAEVHLRKVRGNNLLKTLVERRLKKLDQLLSNYGSDLKRIKITLEHIEKKKLFEAQIVLELPKGTLTCSKQGFSSIEAISKAFKTILQKTNQHKKQLRHENTYQKSITNANASDIEIYFPVESEDFTKSIDKNRDKIMKIITNKLSHYIYYAQELILAREEDFQTRLSFLLPEEIVDSSLLEVMNSFDINDNVTSVEKKLLSTIKSNIEQQLEMYLNDDGKIPLDARTRENMISEDELYDFYQPDNYWHIEDIFEDPNEILPEAIVENDDMLDKLKVVMENLPAGLRKIFYLYYLQGYSKEELSDILKYNTKELDKRFNEMQGVLKRDANYKYLADILRA